MITQVQVDVCIRRLERISKDMHDDAKYFDGKPFNGKTVAEYNSYQGAAIAALADTMRELLIQKYKNKKEK